MVNMKVSIIGSGYVGLVSGVCLAKLGHKVTIVDIDEDKIDMIGKGMSPIYEQGLDELLAQVHIEITSDYRKISNSDIILLCVSTPLSEEGDISLQQVTKATEQTTEALKGKRKYWVVAMRSTLPPGTTEEVIIPILERTGKKLGRDFGVCVSPEFLREGRAIHDFMNPDRLIVGESDKKAGSMLLNLYSSFDVPILRTTIKTAEMIKLASNTFLATKICFINEIGNICKQLGIDSYVVAKGMGFDKRIGSEFLNTGIGFGGSCLPKDLKILIVKAKKMGYEAKLLQEVADRNEKQALRVVELLKNHTPLKGAVIGLLGLAFKPGTDDARGSQAIRIVHTLLSEGAKVRAYDPAAMENFKKLFPQIDYVSKEEVLNCNAIIIATEWEEFKDLDYRGKVVIDGRRILKAKEARVYEGVCW